MYNRRPVNRKVYKNTRFVSIARTVVRTAWPRQVAERLQWAQLEGRNTLTICPTSLKAIIFIARGTSAAAAGLLCTQPTRRSRHAASVAFCPASAFARPLNAPPSRRDLRARPTTYPALAAACSRITCRPPAPARRTQGAVRARAARSAADHGLIARSRPCSARDPRGAGRPFAWPA